MVRFPATSSAPSPFCSTFEDLKLIVGGRAASKKSGDLRCASRAGTRLSIVFTSIVASTLDAPMLPSSITTVPVVLPKWPRTVETARCRTANWESVWLGSIFQTALSASPRPGARAIARRKKSFMFISLGSRVRPRGRLSATPVAVHATEGWLEPEPHPRSQAEQVELLEPDLGRDVEGALAEAEPERELVPPHPRLGPARPQPQRERRVDPAPGHEVLLEPRQDDRRPRRPGPVAEAVPLPQDAHLQRIEGPRDLAPEEPRSAGLAAEIDEGPAPGRDVQPPEPLRLVVDLLVLG